MPVWREPVYPEAAHAGIVTAVHCLTTVHLRQQQTLCLNLHLDGPDSCHRPAGPSKCCGGHLAKMGSLMSGDRGSEATIACTTCIGIDTELRRDPIADQPSWLPLTGLATSVPCGAELHMMGEIGDAGAA